MRRVLQYGWAVTRHWYVLLAGFLGSAIFTAPAWLKPTLSPQIQQRLDQIAGSALSPHIYWWCGVALIFGGFVVASFLAWNDEHESTIELTALKRSAPHFIAVGMPVSPVRATTSAGEHTAIYAIRARFRNDPAIPGEGSVTEVNARVTFFEEGQRRFEMDARWADSVIPTQEVLASRDILNILEARFGVGQEREIELAIKRPRDPACYGFNNDTFKPPKMLCLPERKLTGPEIVARVRLRGVGVDQAWDFTFRNGPATLEPAGWKPVFPVPVDQSTAS